MNGAFITALRAESLSWNKTIVLDKANTFSVQVDRDKAVVLLATGDFARGCKEGEEQAAAFNARPISRIMSLGFPEVIHESRDEFSLAAWRCLALGAWEALMPNVVPQCRAEDWLYFGELSWSARRAHGVELGINIAESYFGGADVLSSDSRIVHEIDSGRVWIDVEAPATAGCHYEVCNFDRSATILSATVFDGYCWIAEVSQTKLLPQFEGRLSGTHPDYEMLKRASDRWRLCNITYARSDVESILLSVRLDIVNSLNPAHWNSFIRHVGKWCEQQY